MSSPLDQLDLEGIILALMVFVAAAIFVGYAAIWVAVAVALTRVAVGALRSLFYKQLKRSASEVLGRIVVNVIFWCIIIALLEVVRKKSGS